MRKLKQEDTRLSNSSATTLRGCEQKWLHYKVLKTEKDFDHEESDALMIGKAFHSIIEHTRHEYPKKIVPHLKRCTEDEDIRLQVEKYPLIIGMVHSYAKYFDQSGLIVLDVETKIEDEDFVGYLDAIVADDYGDWWISDNKTWAYFSPSQAAGVFDNIQMNLYASYAPQIAEKLDLDMKQFKGCRLMVTTKPRTKQKKGETTKEYANRLKDLCATWDILIPIERMKPREHLLRHKWLHDRSLQLREGHDEPTKNFDYCTNWNRACEYWSQCHGTTHTKEASRVKVLGGI